MPGTALESGEVSESHASGSVQQGHLPGEQRARQERVQEWSDLSDALFLRQYN